MFKSISTQFQGNISFSNHSGAFLPMLCFIFQNIPLKSVIVFFLNFYLKVRDSQLYRLFDHLVILSPHHVLILFSSFYMSLNFFDFYLLNMMIVSFLYFGQVFLNFGYCTYSIGFYEYLVKEIQTQNVFIAQFVGCQRLQLSNFEYYFFLIYHFYQYNKYEYLINLKSIIFIWIVEYIPFEFELLFWKKCPHTE